VRCHAQGWVVKGGWGNDGSDRCAILCFRLEWFHSEAEGLWASVIVTSPHISLRPEMAMYIVPLLSTFCERISHVFSPIRMGIAQHACTVSTGEPVGIVGVGTVGVLWGGPKDDGVPATGTRSVLFLVARRAVWPGRARTCVGEGGRGV